jgi:putative ABC transport system ATP-binding protein
MVTHDPRYSEYAERTIHLFDGRIVGEEERANLEPASRVSLTEAVV